MYNVKGQNGDVHMYVHMYVVYLSPMGNGFHHTSTRAYVAQHTVEEVYGISGGSQFSSVSPGCDMVLQTLLSYSFLLFHFDKMRSCT